MLAQGIPSSLLLLLVRLNALSELVGVCLRILLLISDVFHVGDGMRVRCLLLQGAALVFSRLVQLGKSLSPVNGVPVTVGQGLPPGQECPHGVDVHDVPATGRGGVGGRVFLLAPLVHVHGTLVEMVVRLAVLRFPTCLLLGGDVSSPARRRRLLRWGLISPAVCWLLLVAHCVLPWR